MKATALYSSGPAQDVTTSATWTSSNTAVATVAPSGIVTFVAGGTARITATYQGKSGSWDVSVFPIDPSDAISIVSISPAAGTTFTRGATITFNATLQYTLAEDAGHVTAVARVNDNPNAFATITPAIDVAITKGTRSFQTTGTFTIPTSAGPTTALLFQLFPAGAPRTGVFVYAYFPVQ